MQAVSSSCSTNNIFMHDNKNSWHWGRRGRDRMVVGFTTTCVVGAYHHWCCEFESRSGRGVQHHVIKFVNDLPPLKLMLWFSPAIPVSSTNKIDPPDIIEILLKVALNTITLTPALKLILNVAIKTSSSCLTSNGFIYEKKDVTSSWNYKYTFSRA